MYWLDGTFYEGAAPQSLRTGMGVFDTMLAMQGKPQDRIDHYDRLIHDAKQVLEKTPVLPAPETIANLLERNELKAFARVRTTVTPYCVLAEAFECPDPGSLPPLTCTIIDEWPRIAGDALENCKRLDYSRSFAARDKAQKSGADEAILINTEGNIACGATSNLFIVEDGAWITPPLSDGVLAGVTRKHLMEARGAIEESISPARLKATEAVYLTNSIFGVRNATLLR